MSFQFNKAGVADVFEIETLAKRIWPIVYKDMISKEQINYMLQFMYSPNALLKQMNEQKHQFVFLLEAEKNIGFLSYTTLANGEATHRLNKIYLLPSYQGLGLGKKMLLYTEQQVKNRGATALQLNVNKRNPAVAFYTHLGYTLKEEVVIAIGSGFVMDDYILEKKW